MTHTNYTKNILNIKDPNIYFPQNCLEEKIIKGKTKKIFCCILTYLPTKCPKCGCINHNNIIIKWGYKHNCKIILPKVSGYPVELRMSKQRFYCKNCNDTFIATTSLVDKNKNISINTNIMVNLELMDKSSEKDIAKRNDISHSYINRSVDEASKKTPRSISLPDVMNWDEFKATKDTKGKMAFIVCNNKTGQIFDILESRKSNYLRKYFKRYSKKERDKVKIIVTDMYKPYIDLANELFKNADIVIDRFHIVLQAYKALNKARISLCKKSNSNSNKLKHYWKIILKNENELDDKKKTYSKHFKKDMTQKEIISYLINTNQELKNTYNIYQGIINSIKNKNLEKFLNIINNNHKNISPYMIKALKTYKNFEYEISNSFTYEYNNGLIEGTNNLIKCIKRIAFGYRCFSHFKARIMLIKGISKYESKKAQ